MSDTAPFNPADLLYSSLNQSPTDLAATFAASAPQPVVAGTLMADPDDMAGHDPAQPVPATDPGTYELQPDSAVVAPEEATPAAPAEAEPAAPTAPAPAAEPVDLAPVFTQALDDYNATAQAAQDAAKMLADLQGNTEGIAEFTPEMSDAMQAKMKAEAAAERAFDEIGDDSIMLAIQNFPELADDNHPATIAIKSILEATPDIASRSPTAVAELSVQIAKEIRAKAHAPKAPAVPVSQPAPAPGPVPAKAPAPASAMSSHAQAQRPAPGQPATPDIVAQTAAAAKGEGGLAGLFNSVLGSSGNSGSIRMS